MTFREIERLLFEFFKSEGIQPTAIRGEVLLGICATHESSHIEDGREKVVVRTDVNERQIVSLTAVARQLEREISREIREALPPRAGSWPR